MSYFAVIRKPGPGWTEGGIDDAGTAPRAAHHQAQTKAEITLRLADDPWTIAERLATRSIEPWNVFVAMERLAAAAAV